ncbi:MAG: hypothetical protein HQL26_06455 [Candidatus Omnitrophica bacterium]|nr:hypothetical protein [Candidatus Omnitrophota bacterium]
MRNKLFQLTAVWVVTVLLSGCTLFGVKQLSRNNVDQEHASKIIIGQSTRADVEKIFGRTNNIEKKQGMTVITYKGFSGRMAFEKQKLTVAYDSANIVVDYVLNDERELKLTNIISK